MTEKSLYPVKPTSHWPKIKKMISESACTICTVCVVGQLLAWQRSMTQSSQSHFAISLWRDLRHPPYYIFTTRSGKWVFNNFVLRQYDCWETAKRFHEDWTKIAWRLWALDKLELDERTNRRTLAFLNHECHAKWTLVIILDLPQKTK